MNTIDFKFGGGQPKDFSNTPRGWIAVGGGHAVDTTDGTVLLSAECRTIGELRAQGERLKRLIDEAVARAEVYLPNPN